MMSSHIGDAVRQACEIAANAWAWWTRELASLVPSKVSSYFAGTSRFVLRPTPGGVIFAGPDGSSNLVPTDGSAPAITSDLRERLQRADAAILLLPATRVLRRAVDLPLAAASDLASAIPFQIERQTPFRLENASYTFRVLSRNKIKKTIRVELAVTAKTTIEPIRAWLATQDVRLSAIRVDGDEGQPAFSFDHRHNVQRSLWKSALSTEPWKPILAAAVLIACIGPWLIDLKTHESAVAANEAVTHAEAKAKAAARLRNELHDAVLAETFLHDRYGAPRAIELLDATTRALPNDSWVFSWELNAASLRISGFSANVPIMIEHLQAVPFFKKVEFASPVMHDPASHHDRFELLIQIQQAPNEILAAH